MFKLKNKLIQSVSLCALAISTVVHAADPDLALPRRSLMHKPIF